MKAPKNFYNTVDQRKLGLEDGLLPDVTAADNGKILKVTGGKWQPGTDAGEVFTAAITYDAEQEEYSADKTHAEIVAAIAGGSIVLATYDGRTYVYAGSGTEAAGSPVYFSYLQADSESQMIGKVFEIDEDDKITYSQHDINNDTFKRRVYNGTLPTPPAQASTIEVVIDVDYLQNESLVEFFPDANNITLYPTAVSYDTQSAQKTVSLTFAASDVVAGNFQIVVWG